MSSKNEEVQIPEIYAARSEVGNVREHNEDSFIASSPLFVVADGMGGHEAGEVASEIAVNTMADNEPEGPDAEALASAVRLANQAVLRGAADGTGRPGMGTTMTAAVIFEDEVVIAQVGDSRAYLMHAGALQRVTRDHSLVADLVEQGRITEEEARYHPQRSVITRALGSDPNMEPDTYHLRVEPGDRLMLCSDGLSSMLEDNSIEAIMQANPDPQAACDALVDEALAAGGLDNVTVLVIDPLGRMEREEEPTEGPLEAARQLIDTKREGAPASARPAKPARGPKRKHGKAPFIWAIAFVVVIVGACVGFYAYAQNSYYLIAEDGYVALYKGLPGDVAGISFSWEQERTDINVSELAPTTANRLERGISVDSYEAAQELIESYRQTVAGVQAAPAQNATPATSAAPTASDVGSVQ